MNAEDEERLYAEVEAADSDPDIYDLWIVPEDVVREDRYAVGGVVHPGEVPLLPEGMSEEMAEALNRHHAHEAPPVHTEVESALLEALRARGIAVWDRVGADGGYSLGVMPGRAAQLPMWRRAVWLLLDWADAATDWARRVWTRLERGR